MNNTIQIRVNPKTKQSASNVLHALGLDISSGVNIFLRQIIIRQGIPFPILTENGYTREQEEKILAESRQTLEDYKAGRVKGFKSVRAMRKDILSA